MVFYCYGDIIHYDHHGFVFVLMLIWCGCECEWGEWDTYLLGFWGEGGGVLLWDPDAVLVLTISSIINLLFQHGCGCVCGCVNIVLGRPVHSIQSQGWHDFTVLLLLYLYSSMLPLLFWTVCLLLYFTLAEQEEFILFYAFIMTDIVKLNFSVNTKKFKTTGWKTAKDLMQNRLKSMVAELRHFKYM